MTLSHYAYRASHPASRQPFSNKWLVFMAIAGLASGAIAQYGGGSGTPTDPYQIATAEHLAALGERPSDWDQDFRLEGDVDLTGYDETNFSLIGIWEGLGQPANRPFTGTFDGNGKTISNLTYRDASGSYAGLFRVVQIGEVTDLTLENVTIIANGSGTGALVGYLKGASLSDCSVKDVRVSGDWRVGGLVGHSDGGVSNSCSRGYVSGVQYVGGLIGYVDEGTVSRSYSRATVVGDESAGGLIGATGHEYAVVNACYATGSVSGTHIVGGFIGWIIQGTVNKCYSLGPVSGDQSVGGFAGRTGFNGEVRKSFWDIETSHQTESYGGTGKTTAEMRSYETFFDVDVGWNTSFWAICDGMNSPVFWWQIPVGDFRCPDGVELIDFALFALQWRHGDCDFTDSCEGTDFDESGEVGYSDLAILAENWLVGTVAAN